MDRYDTELLIQEWMRQAQRGFKPRLPKTGESAAFAPKLPKTAALCFDRIWWPHTKPFPSPIADLLFYDTKGFEKWLLALDLAERSVSDVSDFDDDVILPRALEELAQHIPDRPLPHDATFDDTLERVVRPLSMQYRERGFNVVPCYETLADRDADFCRGDSDAVVVAALRETEIVDESQLTWEQVITFRNDERARRRYRRMVHWLDGSMIGRSKGWVVDELGQRHEDYETALKDHEIETVSGVLSTLLSPSALQAAAAVTAGLSVGGVPIGTAGVVGTLTLGGNILVELLNSSVDLRKTERDNIEVAFLHEAKSKLGS